MNPMLIPLVVIGGIGLWFILSSAFHLIGNIIDRIGKHTAGALDMETTKNDESAKTENGGNEND